MWKESNSTWVCRVGLDGLSCPFQRDRQMATFVESVPSLPACPLYQSFGPINTVTPITTTYLQENKPVGSCARHTTSTRTKDFSVPRKALSPGFGGAHF